jgi:hypothetical protein
MRIAVVRLITFWGRSAGIVAFLRLTITVVALVVVVAFRRRSVAVVGFRRGSIAGRRRIGVRGGGHIAIWPVAIAVRGIAIAAITPAIAPPIITPPITNLFSGRI